MAKKEKLFLWGTGVVAKRVLKSVELDDKYDVLGIIDSNSAKWGEKFFGYSICSPEVLKKKEFDFIVVLSDAYFQISNQVEEILGNRVPILSKNYFFEKEIEVRYRESDDSEIQRVYKNIVKNGLDVFNYDYVKKYDGIEVLLDKDEECGLYYVLHKGKKMYMKRSLNTVDEVEKYYQSLLIEQDQESPHHYLDDEFQLPEEAVIADIGAAEGIFTLENIERIKKAYVFECDDEWIEALTKTLEPFDDKVTIIHKYVSDCEDERRTLLDNYKECGLNFIKMDIEGAECDALEGAKKLLCDAEDIKCAICAYHTEYDEQAIRWILQEFGLKTSTTDGYMWFPYDVKDKKVSTKLVRGIVRAEKR